jgi:hypothetical protein
MVPGHKRRAKPSVPDEIEEWLEYLSPMLNFSNKDSGESTVST